jgi:uncharacterized protein (DUF1800 family)
VNATRRDLLKAAAAGSIAAAVGGCTPITARLASREPAIPLPPGPVDSTARLLARTTFGHRPGDVARVQSQGRAAFVAQELAADRPEDPRLRALMDQLEITEFDSADLEDLPKDEVVDELHRASVIHAIYGANQLQERMVDLWSDHFNIYALKGDTAFRESAADVSVVRKNALGKFPDLLSASAHSPAMLGYLDSQLNRKGVANENYARELMELHTMGVHGGYTQRDVQEVARCLTGWTIENRFLLGKGKFRFDADRHDDGEKWVLGHRIPAGGGQQDGETVLSILGSHPSTARFVATKMVRYFLGSPDEKWVAQTAKIYLATGGDIKEMLRPILLSHELTDSAPMIKRPLDYLASAIRATNADTDAGQALLSHLTDMGQVAHGWPMPDGYPMRTAAWTGSMLPRWNFAVALAQGKIGGTTTGELGGPPFEATHGRHTHESDHALISACEGKDLKTTLALCLASPSFQWR